MSTMKQKGRPQEGVEEEPDMVASRLSELLPAGVLDDVVKGLRPEDVSGPGGLLSQLAGRVIEAALAAEMTEHVGHPPGGEPSGTNRRNGSTPKTVQTTGGPIQIQRPRDRNGSYEPQIVKNGQRRFEGFDEQIIACTPGG